MLLSTSTTLLLSRSFLLATPLKKLYKILSCFVYNSFAKQIISPCDSVEKTLQNSFMFRLQLFCKADHFFLRLRWKKLYKILSCFVYNSFAKQIISPCDSVEKSFTKFFHVSSTTLLLSRSFLLVTPLKKTLQNSFMFLLQLFC